MVVVLEVPVLVPAEAGGHRVLSLTKITFCGRIVGVSSF